MGSSPLAVVPSLPGAGEERESFFSLIDEAANLEADRREKSLGKLRKFEREEAARQEKANARVKKKDEKKRELLQKAKELKKVSKAAKNPAVSYPTMKKAPGVTKPKKRVSFSKNLTS